MRIIVLFISYITFLTCALADDSRTTRDSHTTERIYGVDVHKDIITTDTGSSTTRSVDTGIGNTYIHSNTSTQNSNPLGDTNPTNSSSTSRTVGAGTRF